MIALPLPRGALAAVVRARGMLLGLAVLLVLLLAAPGALAQGVLPVPELTAHVVDQTDTLDAIQRQGLEQKLMAFEQAKGSQMVVLIVPTTQPEDIASYANRVGNAWKIGRKEVGDGILIVVAKSDRKVRIEVAKTLEGAVPDLMAKRVIDEAITPRFRQGDFAGGLQAGVDRLVALVSGEGLPAPRAQQKPSRGDGFDWFDLAIFLFFAVPIAGAVLRTMFGRKLGTMLVGGGVGAAAFFITSSLVVAVIAAIVALVFSLVAGSGPAIRPGRGRHGWGGPAIGTGSWGGGHGGWGGGGGGGWGGSGGGGDFGGGGASGDW